MDVRDVKWGRLILLGPVFGAPPEKRGRALIDWAVTLVAATAPILIGVVIAPAFRNTGSPAGDYFGGIKHGELFVATSSLLAPILSVIVRREWPDTVRSSVSVISIALISLALSVGFFFALLAFPAFYSDGYVIFISFGTFTLASLALVSYTAQAIGLPPPTPATVSQAREQDKLGKEMDTLLGKKP
jgi:hypothetical protein